MDYIVVGSGCTAAMAAQTLCTAGVKVLMLDAGVSGDNVHQTGEDFISKRFGDEAQADFFLGKHFEALGTSAHPNMPQQTAQRMFMTALTDQYLRVHSENFFPVESLAYGGLGNGWGLGAYAFSDAELTECALPVGEMRAAYRVVADRIGISGDQEDDAAVYCHNHLYDIQPPLQLNTASDSLLKRYKQRKQWFHHQGIYVGRPGLALLTQAKDGRQAYKYQDLDFYTNEGASAYRPSITIDQLIRSRQLQYEKGWMVQAFSESPASVSIDCIHIETAERKIFNAKKLVLATGTLGTARIVLRSFERQTQLPVLCNPYTYMPMLYLPALGKQHTGRFCGLAQLAMFYDPAKTHADVTMASIYNYRSLLNFRLLRQMPLNHADGIRFLNWIVPALFIAGIFHPAAYQEQNFVQLQEADTPTHDVLKAVYSNSKQVRHQLETVEQVYQKAFTRLGCIRLKKMQTPMGGSIHYAGTLPFSKQSAPYRLSPEGRLHGTQHVFVADGSGFSFLPGKGLTLSLMAFAHIVATKSLQYG